jgi:hypothetical protein
MKAIHFFGAKGVQEILTQKRFELIVTNHSIVGDKARFIGYFIAYFMDNKFLQFGFGKN